MEVKFRGKRIDNEEWVYGFYTKGIRGGKEYHFIISDMGLYYENSIRYQELVEVDPETVGQYTGKKDCIGKEIYDGSIIKAWKWSLDEDFEQIIDESSFDICRVYWNDKLHCWSVEGPNKNIITDFLGHSAKTEVIGDIHTTPELLEKYTP